LRTEKWRGREVFILFSHKEEREGEEESEEELLWGGIKTVKGKVLDLQLWPRTYEPLMYLRVYLRMYSITPVILPAFGGGAKPSFPSKRR
jgi:hypothetical protein